MINHYFPVDTRRRFNVYKTSIDVETTSCVYWVIAIGLISIHIKYIRMSSMFRGD